MRSEPLALFVTVLALVAGCDCAGPPARGCRNASDCTGGRVCVDERCELPPDAPGLDAPSGVDAPADAPPIDAPPFDANCVSLSCGTSEGCFDGIDEDCDDSVDEDCTCIPGTTARCLPGRLDPSVSRCSWGEMTCEGTGEFGMWSACVGGTASPDGGTSLYGCRRIGIMGAPGALASSNFQAWLETQGAIATRFHETAAAPTLRREELETFDLVVVDWLQRLYTTEEAMTLSDWVNAGGALFVMTGHDSGATADRHVSLLATLGPNYDLAAGPLNGPATLVAHPTTDDGAGGTLPPVTFNGGLRVIVPASLAGDVVTMAVIGTEVVGAAGPLGDGFVLLFGDEWIEFDSEWAAMPPIPRFWENSVRWLSPDEPAIPACTDG